MIRILAKFIVDSSKDYLEAPREVVLGYYIYRGTMVYVYRGYS